MSKVALGNLTAEEIYNIKKRIETYENAFHAMLPKLIQDALPLPAHGYKFANLGEIGGLSQKLNDMVHQLAEGSQTSPDKAYCPLCRKGATSIYVGEQGWALPHGLDMHLNGMGRTRQCDVWAAVSDMLREYRRPLVDIDLAHKAAIRAERFRSGPTYIVGRGRTRELWDEHYGARPVTETATVEKDLEALGFAIERTGDAISYRMVLDGLDIYADPREKGRVTFHVYYPPSSFRGKGLRSCEVFYLLDGWRKDRLGKFENRLATAIQTIREKEQMKLTP